MPHPAESSPGVFSLPQSASRRSMPSYFMDVEITKTFARPIDAITEFGPRPALAMIKLANPGVCIE